MLPSGEAADLERVRQHTREVIEEASSAEGPVLVEAPPSSARSTAACELAAETDTPLTYLAGRADLRERAVDWCENQSGLSHTMLPVPHRECPTFGNENRGTEITARRFLNKGYSAEEVHHIDAVYTPCQSPYSTCPYIAKKKDIETTAQEIDLLVGNYNHLEHSPYVEDRIVVLDGYRVTPFQTRFPPESTIETLDALGDIIPYFSRRSTPTARSSRRRRSGT